MATKTLRTRIGLKYDTYENWTLKGNWNEGIFTPNSSGSSTFDTGFIPKKGEVCFYEIPASSNSGLREPAIVFKVGDGVTTLKNLSWGSAIAADVYAWAKNQSLLGGTNNGGTWTWSSDSAYSQEQNEVAAFIKRETSNIKVKVDQVTEQNFQDIYGITYDPNNPTHVARIGKYQVSVSTEGGASGTWTASGEPFDIEVSYTAGNGLNLNNNQFSVKPKQGGLVTVDDNGVDVATASVASDMTVTGTGAITNSSIGNIKTYIDNSIPNVPVYTIEKSNTATAGYLATYILKKDGVQEGDAINIPKDFLVKDASIIDVVEYEGNYYDSTDTQHENPLPVDAVGKYIDFEINVKTGTATIEHLYLNVDDLVEAYTAGNGISIDSNNAINIVPATGSFLEFDGGGVQTRKSSVTYTPSSGTTAADLTADNGLLTNQAITPIKNYIDDKVEHATPTIPEYTSGTGIDITDVPNSINKAVNVKIASNEGIAVNANNELKVDESLTWIFECGAATTNW